MSVKIYAMNKATPEIKEVYNADFIEPAIKKSDYDKLEARCKELEEELAIIDLRRSLFESENHTLKAKLELKVKQLQAAIEELKNECYAWAEDSHADEALEQYKEDLAANIQAAMDSVKC